MPAYPHMSEITMFVGAFAPRGSMFCNGQLIPIAQNQALFALLGTNYGGDGRTTFGLPDLRGALPVGNTFGLTPHGYFCPLGSEGGFEELNLQLSQLPSHSHVMNASNTLGDKDTPTDNILAQSNSRYSIDLYSDTQSSNIYLNSQAVAITGNSSPIPTRSPYSSVNFILWSDGIFPSRN